MIERLDHLLELVSNARVAALCGVCIGLYLLRDIARATRYIFISSRRAWSTHREEDE